LSDTSDTPDRPGPGFQTLVLRAAFVPEGEQPPPEFGPYLHPLRFPATRDPKTGTITCTNAAVSFGGSILAQWHPDEVQDGDEADQGSRNKSDGATGG
jgi:hypothetical protein